MKIIGLPILRRGAAKPGENARMSGKDRRSSGRPKAHRTRRQKSHTQHSPRVYAEKAERVAKRSFYEVEIRPVVSDNKVPALLRARVWRQHDHARLVRLAPKHRLDLSAGRTSAVKHQHQRGFFRRIDTCWNVNQPVAVVSTRSDLQPEDWSVEPLCALSSERRQMRRSRGGQTWQSILSIEDRSAVQQRDDTEIFRSPNRSNRARVQRHVRSAGRTQSGRQRRHGRIA
jgi:hypothetical protein